MGLERQNSTPSSPCLRDQLQGGWSPALMISTNIRKMPIWGLGMYPTIPLTSDVCIYKLEFTSLCSSVASEMSSFSGDKAGLVLFLSVQQSRQVPLNSFSSQVPVSSFLTVFQPYLTLLFLLPLFQHEVKLHL